MYRKLYFLSFLTCFLQNTLAPTKTQEIELDPIAALEKIRSEIRQKIDSEPELITFYKKDLQIFDLDFERVKEIFTQNKNLLNRTLCSLTKLHFVIPVANYDVDIAILVRYFYSPGSINGIKSFYENSDYFFILRENMRDEIVAFFKNDTAIVLSENFYEYIFSVKNDPYYGLAFLKILRHFFIESHLARARLNNLPLLERSALYLFCELFKFGNTNKVELRKLDELSSVFGYYEISLIEYSYPELFLVFFRFFKKCLEVPETFGINSEFYSVYEKIVEVRYKNPILWYFATLKFDLNQHPFKQLFRYLNFSNSTHYTSFLQFVHMLSANIESKQIFNFYFVHIDNSIFAQLLISLSSESLVSKYFKDFISDPKFVMSLFLIIFMNAGFEPFNFPEKLYDFSPNKITPKLVELEKDGIQTISIARTSQLDAFRVLMILADSSLFSESILHTNCDRNSSFDYFKNLAESYKILNNIKCFKNPIDNLLSFKNHEWITFKYVLSDNKIL